MNYKPSHNQNTIYYKKITYFFEKSAIKKLQSLFITEHENFGFSIFVENRLMSHISYALVIAQRDLKIQFKNHFFQTVFLIDQL